MTLGTRPRVGASAANSETVALWIRGRPQSATRIRQWDDTIGGIYTHILRWYDRRVKRSLSGLTGEPPSDSSRARLYVLASIVVLMTTFAMGARSWAQFFMSPDEANGVPVRLFTQTDYPAIAIASRLIASGRGGELYNLEAQREEQDALAAEGYLDLPQGAELKYPYPYTPFIAVLWSPLAGLSPLIGMALWDLLNITALAGGLWYLLAALSLPHVTRVLLLLAALTSFPFIVNLEQGQSSGVVIGALAIGIALLRKEKDLLGGLVLGLLLLKTQWLLFIVLLLLWKLRWRALLGIATTGVALGSLTLLIMGTDWIPDFQRILAMVQRWDRSLLLDPWFSHSLSGGLTALLGRGTDEAVRAIMLFATLLMVLTLGYLWRGAWRPGSLRWDALVALTLLATIFTNLQLNTHDLVLLVLPGVLGLSALYRLGELEQMRAWWYALLWASYLIPAFFLDVTFSWPIRLTTLLIAALLGVAFVVIKSPSTCVGRGGGLVPN